MKLAIMQPYFLPYIGYFQLINSADEFVVYDNIKYTKKGWINRNYMLGDIEKSLFTIPIKSASDYLTVVQREISPAFDRQKLMNQFIGAYRKAPFFTQVKPLLEKIIYFNDLNLFRYIYNSINEVCRHLGIETRLRISSEIFIDNQLSGQSRVIATCNSLGAKEYINAIGGQNLYDSSSFQSAGLDLYFIRSKSFSYPQFDANHVPSLSIIDVLMFNSIDCIMSQLIKNFDILTSPIKSENEG